MKFDVEVTWMHWLKSATGPRFERAHKSTIEARSPMESAQRVVDTNPIPALADLTGCKVVTTIWGSRWEVNDEDQTPRTYWMCRVAKPQREDYGGSLTLIPEIFINVNLRAESL